MHMQTDAVGLGEEEMGAAGRGGGDGAGLGTSEDFPEEGLLLGLEG